MTELGEKIRYAKQRSRLTHQEISDRGGFSKEAIREWQNGSRVPSSELLARFASVVGVSTDSLLSHFFIPLEQGEE